MKIKSFGSIVGLALALVTTQARAAVYDPFGPQNDVSLSTVLSGGWTMIYQGAYSDFVTVATMFSGADTYVMLGAMRTGDDDPWLYWRWLHGLSAETPSAGSGLEPRSL